jgi:hypothetical protein
MPISDPSSRGRRRIDSVVVGALITGAAVVVAALIDKL